MTLLRRGLFDEPTLREVEECAAEGWQRAYGGSAQIAAERPQTYIPPDSQAFEDGLVAHDGAQWVWLQRVEHDDVLQLPWREGKGEGSFLSVLDLWLWTVDGVIATATTSWNVVSHLFSSLTRAARRAKSNNEKPEMHTCP